MTVKFKYCTLACVSILLLVSEPSGAQQSQRLETVANRDRPALDPIGVRLGGLTLTSSLGVQGEYNDNIFADDRTTVEDVVVSAIPQISLASDWSKHSLSIDAYADMARYRDNDSEDYDDFAIRSDGRVDINRFSYISGYLSHSNEHQPRTSREDIKGASLTTLTVDTASVTYYRKPNRVLFRLNWRGRDRRFDDAVSPEGIIDNGDRDRREQQQNLRLGYEFLPGSVLFLQGTAVSWDYDRKTDNAGFARSSDGYDAVFGISREISGVSSADVFVGYLYREFDDQRFETVDGVSFGADIVWNVTNLITINAKASRTIEPTAIVGVSGISSDQYGIAMDYEVLRNLIVTANLKWADDDYLGTDRSDEKFEAGVGLQYMLNRNLRLYIEFGNERRDVVPQNFAVDEFNVNKVSIQVQGLL